jgi:hypothetical protein
VDKIFKREIVLLLLIALSLYTTKDKVRELNHFTWRPIIEVAVVFRNFYYHDTALIYLNENAASFGLHSPAHFYYATGALSSFLDNAPTALPFTGLPRVSLPAVKLWLRWPVFRNIIESYLGGRSIFWSHDLYRQRPQFYGKGYCRS